MKPSKLRFSIGQKKIWESQQFQAGGPVAYVGFYKFRIYWETNGKIGTREGTGGEGGLSSKYGIFDEVMETLYVAI